MPVTRSVSYSTLLDLQLSLLHCVVVVVYPAISIISSYGISYKVYYYYYYWSFNIKMKWKIPAPEEYMRRRMRQLMANRIAN